MKKGTFIDALSLVDPGLIGELDDAPEKEKHNKNKKIYKAVLVFAAVAVVAFIAVFAFSSGNAGDNGETDNDGKDIPSVEEYGAIFADAEPVTDAQADSKDRLISYGAYVFGKDGTYLTFGDYMNGSTFILNDGKLERIQKRKAMLYPIKELTDKDGRVYYFRTQLGCIAFPDHRNGIVRFDPETDTHELILALDHYIWGLSLRDGVLYYFEEGEKTEYTATVLVNDVETPVKEYHPCMRLMAADLEKKTVSVVAQTGIWYFSNVIFQTLNTEDGIYCDGSVFESENVFKGVKLFISYSGEVEEIERYEIEKSEDRGTKWISRSAAVCKNEIISVSWVIRDTEGKYVFDRQKLIRNYYSGYAEEYAGNGEYLFCGADADGLTVFGDRVVAYKDNTVFLLDLDTGISEPIIKDVCEKEGYEPIMLFSKTVHDGKLYFIDFVNNVLYVYDGLDTAKYDVEN